MTKPTEICEIEGCDNIRDMPCKGGRLRKRCRACIVDIWSQGLKEVEIDSVDEARSLKRARKDTFKVIDSQSQATESSSSKRQNVEKTAQLKVKRTTDADRMKKLVDMRGDTDSELEQVTAGRETRASSSKSLKLQAKTQGKKGSKGSLNMPARN